MTKPNFKMEATLRDAIDRARLHVETHEPSPPLYKWAAITSTGLLSLLLFAVAFILIYQASGVADPIEVLNEKRAYAKRLGDEALVTYREFRIHRRVTLRTQRVIVGLPEGVITEGPIKVQERYPLPSTTQTWEPDDYAVRTRLDVPVDLPKGFNYVIQSTTCWDVFLRTKCLPLPAVPLFNDTEVDK